MWASVGGGSTDAATAVAGRGSGACVFNPSARGKKGVELGRRRRRYRKEGMRILRVSPSVRRRIAQA
jgi:hypothetical protein